MKIIFLDIDGVLAPIPRPFNHDYFTDSCVRHLETILKEVPESRIVISSTWRIGNNLQELRKMFRKRGFRLSDRIIGKTTDYTDTGEFNYLTRGEEISEWLISNPSVESYCVIDDDTDISPHEIRWVRPKGNEGIQHHDARDCVRILREEIKCPT